MANRTARQKAASKSKDWFFYVGPFGYRLRILPPEQVVDSTGKRVEALACWGIREILLNQDVVPEAREEVMLHEMTHCWEYHVPPPRTVEERADLNALICAAFNVDVRRQGGLEALMALQPESGDVMELAGGAA